METEGEGKEHPVFKLFQNNMISKHFQLGCTKYFFLQYLLYPLNLFKPSSYIKYTMHTHIHKHTDV